MFRTIKIGEVYGYRGSRRMGTDKGIVGRQNEKEGKKMLGKQAIYEVAPASSFSSGDAEECWARRSASRIKTSRTLCQCMAVLKAFS